MGITPDYDQARVVLGVAIRMAKSNTVLPHAWIERTSMIARSPSKTYLAALGTALLAKATEPRIDAMALKESSGERAYSARNLCHKVLVPAAAQYGIDLIVTGREPLNNQPFFRYDRIDEMDRVHRRAADWHKYLIECITEINQLDAQQARVALAAFLRQRADAKPEPVQMRLQTSHLSVASAMAASRDLLSEDAEGGKRAQALVAAMFDLVYEDVRTAKVNDPSRHFPGDVQAFVNGMPIVAAEVRSKPVLTTEVVTFANHVFAAGFEKCAVIALAQGMQPLPRVGLIDVISDRFNGLLVVIESPQELLSEVLSWSHRPLDELLSRLPGRVEQRLTELEVQPETLQRWSVLCT